jgi:hypothetical protein
MNIYIYILLFILLIIYINISSNYQEKFDNYDKYDLINKYNVKNNSQSFQQIQIDFNSDLIPGFNSNDNFSKKFKNYSDIYRNLERKNIFNKIKKEMIQTTTKYNNNNYNILGIATNKFYDQYFYIFENVVKQKLSNPLLVEQLKYMENNKIFQYLLVKMQKDKPKIIHWIGPRNKININDVVYLSLGIIQLGPLVINEINSTNF